MFYMIRIDLNFMIELFILNKNNKKISKPKKVDKQIKIWINIFDKSNKKGFQYKNLS